jgi:superfamily II DNA or RNA helicase
MVGDVASREVVTVVSDWGDESLAAHVELQTKQCLEAYRAKPNLIEQDAGIEISNVEGGYGRKQLHELVQNAADALLGCGGTIALVLANGTFYAANEGSPLTASGVETIMASHLSRKRDEEIGRFGLGFKSVLGISDRPEILSRRGSIRFDRQESERLCREINPGSPHTPVLRIGFPVDPLAEAESDAVLSSLMEWATTVVRLPLKDGTNWIGEELLKFPPEFLLFSDHVHELVLRNDDAGTKILWWSITDGNSITLKSETDSSVWDLFRTEHLPSDAAKADAGIISGREKLQITWAVPRKGRTRQGSFWSSFPTNSRTTLSGIINTAFKTNEDRHDILEGAYNAEILTKVLPELIASNLSQLVDLDDPASILEILPSRGREERSWADEIINDPIMSAVSATECLPDADGVLVNPGNVKLHPAFLVELNSWKERWAAVEGRPSNWVHHTVDKTPERRAKALRLIRLAGGTEQNVGEWLHDLAAQAGVAGSQESIKLAELIDKQEAEYMMDMRRSEFVLAADNTLRRPQSGRIFLPESDTADGRFVHPDVVADPTVVVALEALGIGRLDQKGRLRAQVAEMATRQHARADVETLWSLTRGLPHNDVVTVLENGFRGGGTPVLSIAGSPEAISKMLLPGVIVPPDGSRDRSLTIDMKFHAPDRTVLLALGATGEPPLGIPSEKEMWFQAWRNAALEAYSTWITGKGIRFQASRVKHTAGRTYRGLDIMSRLSEEGKFALTQYVLNGDQVPWHLDLTSNNPEYRMMFTNPALWYVIKEGFVDTAYGLRTVNTALGHIAGIPSHLLPVAKLPEVQQKDLGLKTRLDEDDWREILRRPWKYLRDQAALGELYGYAAAFSAPTPDDIAVQIGVKKTVSYPEETYVTADKPVYELAAVAHPVIFVADPDHVKALIGQWKLHDAAELVNRSVLAAISGEAVPLSDRFPGLRVVADVPQDIDLVPCSDLSVESRTQGASGPVVTEHEVLRDGESTLYFLDKLTDPALLGLLNYELRLGLEQDDLHRALKIGMRSEAKRFSIRVKHEPDQDKKLLLLAGVDALRNEIPQGAISLAERRQGRKLEDTEIAAMARMAKGAALVERLRPVIAEKGIELPALSGGAQARAAMRELGLPEEFAGSRTASRAPRIEVLGPVKLPGLHSYQTEVVDKLLSVVRPGGKNRGLVALPTGSGKTRVAVEALIQFAQEADFDPLILWIAQSDELCEQAVDAWRYAWSAIGPQGVTLTLSRLWGANDATPIDDGIHLVVATDDKLASLCDRGQHEWLADAHVVLVDEAHTSISPTYTKLFDWLKRGARERDRTLLGLSATPYRGRNEEQTKTLVNRYDANLLTDGVLGDEPYEELQEMGILARVRHEELDGMVLTPSRGATRSESETVHFDDYRIDLNAVASDKGRNEKILDSLESLPADMTALVFTASVQHAEMLAAVLAGNGIPAASVAGYTPSAERRRLIERFRTGDVRVLTNYNVLSQGFDAPKVGAVYVTRPTFSPNRYQQMIGRGLRGPKNGGSEEVLIVNVRDNIEAFGTQLAFTHFDKLWTNGR